MFRVLDSRGQHLSYLARKNGPGLYQFQLKEIQVIHVINIPKLNEVYWVHEVF